MSLELFHTPSRKRARDDEEHQHPEAKRATRSLPFRISPTTKHTRLYSQSKRFKAKPLFTQTLTPADSEEEISPPFSVPKAHNEHILAQDDDVDMMDVVLSPRREHSDMAMGSPSASPRTLLPQMKSMQDEANTGRLPTPIYGHFQQSSVLATREGTPPRSDKDMEYEQYLRSRRLPSPISEDEAMDFPAAPTNSPLETSAPVETPHGDRGLRTPVRMAQPLTNQSPPRGKIMFSMGFRANCEMCRNRVPGHSNHIFRVE